jgi:uncharacterized protein YodC (DUF2158 family)
MTAMQTEPTAIQVGDKVTLNSGGPVMEVIGLSRHGKVWCEWPTSSGQTDDASFDAPMLRAAT